MSRSYDIMVRVRDFKGSRLNAIEKACLAEWPFEEECFSVRKGPRNRRVLSGQGMGSLCAGESEEEFADRLAMAIWKANQGYCEVEVHALYMENMPYEQHVREEDDYRRLVKTRTQTAAKER